MWPSAVGALIVAAAAAAPAGEVSGRFTAGEKTIVPVHAAAYPVRDQRDARRIAIEVVLSEGKVDAERAALALDPHTEAINQEGLRSGGYVLLWVRPDGEVSMNATFPETMTQYVDGTRGLLKGLEAELTVNTPERVAGRVRTRKPVKTAGGETYALDLTFSTAVARAPAATKLAAGAGEPGKALEALAAAIARKDGVAVRSRVGRATLASLEADYRTAEENRTAVLEMLTAWLPKKKLRATGGELRGEVAILDVEGELFEGRTGLWLVRMLKEDGEWRFDQAAMAGLL